MGRKCLGRQSGTSWRAWWTVIRGGSSFRDGPSTRGSDVAEIRGWFCKSLHRLSRSRVQSWEDRLDDYASAQSCAPLSASPVSAPQLTRRRVLVVCLRAQVGEGQNGYGSGET